MVDLSEAKKGDYVLFKCGGHALIVSIQDDGDDDDNYPMQLEFAGYDDTWYYTRSGGDSTDGASPLDIKDVVPAAVVERELKKKAEEEYEDEIPF